MFFFGPGGPATFIVPIPSRRTAFAARSACTEAWAPRENEKRPGACASGRWSLLAQRGAKLRLICVLCKWKKVNHEETVQALEDAALPFPIEIDEILQRGAADLVQLPALALLRIVAL